MLRYCHGMNKPEAVFCSDDVTIDISLVHIQNGISVHASILCA